MITIRLADDRGHADYGWLDTHYSFSFADYFDTRHMGFRDLRVINEDRVQGGKGFGMHGHRDMEIVTYVLSGALEHRDSMGNGAVMRRGDVQHMSAGTGVRHSEFNPSAREPLHLLQIWLMPEREDIHPGYEQKTFSEEEKRNQLRLLASHDGDDGSLTMHQNAKIFASVLDGGKSVRYALSPGRHAWVQVASGAVDVNGTRLSAGDGAAISEESALAISGQSKQASEFLLFDLA
jgi:hypothetical protein